MAFTTGFSNIKLGVDTTGAAASDIGFIYDKNGNTVLSEQQANVVSLTDNSGGTADDTVAAVSGSGDDTTINNNFADLAAKVNELNAVLEAHGLSASS